jgi:teichuronic acid biosynthesis protein TuaE
MLEEKRDIIYKSLFFLFIVSLAGGAYMLNFKMFGVEFYAFRIFLALNTSILFLNKDIVLYKSSFTKLVFYFFIFWILYAITSILWCSDLNLAIHEIGYLIIGFISYIYLFSISYYFKKRFRDFVLVNWIYALIPTFLIALFEINTGKHLEGNYLKSLRELEFLHANNFSPVTTFDNPNNLAIYLSLSLVFLTVLIRKGRFVFLFSFLFSVNLYLMILTGSRIGLIFSLLLMLIVITTKVIEFLHIGFKKNYFKIVGSLILFLLMFVFNEVDVASGSEISHQQKLLNEYHEKVKKAYGSNAYDSLSVNVRKNLFLSGVDFASSSYLIGVGAGSFEAKMKKGENKYPTYGMPNPHNYFIEVFSQYGILITLIILSFFIFIGWRVLLSLYNSIAFEESLFILLLISCYGLLSNANSSFLPLPLNWFMFSLIIILFDKFYSKDGIKY